MNTSKFVCYISQAKQIATFVLLLAKLTKDNSYFLKRYNLSQPTCPSPTLPFYISTFFLLLANIFFLFSLPFFFLLLLPHLYSSFTSSSFIFYSSSHYHHYHLLLHLSHLCLCGLLSIFRDTCVSFDWIVTLQYLFSYIYFISMYFDVLWWRL